MKILPLMMKMWFPLLVLSFFLNICTADTPDTPDTPDTLNTSNTPNTQNVPDENGACSFDFSVAEAWHLPSGKGQRLAGADGVTGAVLELVGDGNHSSAWQFTGLFPYDKLRAGSRNSNCPNWGLAMFRFKARAAAGSGSGGMTGPGFANKDFTFTDQWKTYSIVFAIPDKYGRDALRLGQWMANGTFQFAEAQILPLRPAYSVSGSQAGKTEKQPVLALGKGELYNPIDGIYRFSSNFDSLSGNSARVLDRFNCTFNSSRWCFGSSNEVIYRFDAPESAEGQKFISADLEATIGYHVGGSMKIEYSTDNQSWRDAGALDKASTITVPLAELNSASVWVRFSGSPNSSFQLYAFNFQGKLDGGLKPTGSDLSAETASYSGQTLFWELVSGDAGFPLPKAVDLPKNQPGMKTYQTEIAWQDAEGVSRKSTVQCQYYVSDYYREDYGYLLPGVSVPNCPVWWTESTYKIAPMRQAPAAVTTPDTQKSQVSEASESLKAKAVVMSAAGNDRESAQIVFRPNVKTTLKFVKIEDFQSDSGAKIPASNAELRSVYYHFVDHTTDSTGVRDFWPDALVPITGSVIATAGKNCPFWLTVAVPAGTPAGKYTSTIVMNVTGKDATGNDVAGKDVSIPVELTVWGFDLPKQNHVETAFGFSPGSCWSYHGVKTDADRRQVLDSYFQLMSQYRISPFNPVPMDPFSMNFVVDSENPSASRAEFDFSRFDKAFAAAVEKYNFTGYSLPIQGMGGGTFHQRWEPSLKGFKEDSVEYKAMFKSQVEQLQSHFKQKGWLDMTYVYWFDEPDSKDYEFVRNGMNRIKQYSPEIPTMLTEEPSQKTVDETDLGHVDIWCPVTPCYNHDLANQCRAQGSRFWTYVCCWPHAPYCTEFIDHSAVELRTWLWQTWQNNINGILVWQSNYWTSGSAFPDPAHPQNPYLDPMCYVSGYSTPAGTKRFWGNGDGRFFYPPLSCATPSAEPNLEAPVPSIRLAMLREGVEDYEMIYLLKQKIDQASAAGQLTADQKQAYEQLLTVPETITKSWTEFSFTPQPILERRAAIAQAIEELSQLK